MNFFLKCVLLLTLALPIDSSFAQFIVKTDIDYESLATQCSALALRLNTLSRAQDHPSCVSNLDGLNVYYASNYISFKWVNKAIELLIAAIIQVQYARDIDCYCKEDIQDVLKNLISIKNQLLEIRQ